MEMRIITQGKSDPPQLANLPEPVINLTANETMSICLVESGMVSGEPSVIIISSDREGSVCLQTSLDKFLMAATGMMAAAQGKWGWKQPDGYATLMPMDNDARKAILESIKKELEEWDS